MLRLQLELFYGNILRRVIVDLLDQNKQRVKFASNLDAWTL